MFNKIRNELMNDTDATPLDGFVEVDETGVSGRKRTRGTRSEGARRREAQPVVLDIVNARRVPGSMFEQLIVRACSSVV